MTGFEVDPRALRSAAEAVNQAADAVRKLDLKRVAELAKALTGTESAGTAAELGPHWESTTDRWAKGMDSYAAALIASATTYETQDETAEHGLGGMRGR